LKSVGLIKAHTVLDFFEQTRDFKISLTELKIIKSLPFNKMYSQMVELGEDKFLLYSSRSVDIAVRIYGDLVIQELAEFRTSVV
jgi:hypothetical protein